MSGIGYSLPSPRPGANGLSQLDRIGDTRVTEAPLAVHCDFSSKNPRSQRPPESDALCSGQNASLLQLQGPTEGEPCGSRPGTVQSPPGNARPVPGKPELRGALPPLSGPPVTSGRHACPEHAAVQSPWVTPRGRQQFQTFKK